MKNFKMIPDEIQNYVDAGKITIKEWTVATWIYTHYNPHNGKCIISYADIVQLFKGIISYDSARQIFGKLRRLKIITFISHRGAGGRFEVFPNKIKLKGNVIQVIDEQGLVQYATDDDDDHALYPPAVPILSQLFAQNHNSDVGQSPERLPKEPPKEPVNHNSLDTDLN